jgi:heme/copper-type cytochrome/quinol oxidase subunit 3
MFVGARVFPLGLSIIRLCVFIGVLNWFVLGRSVYFGLGLVILLIGLFLFGRDMFREIEGGGFLNDMSCGKFGVLLFIFSEVMLFFSLFWLNLNFMLSGGWEVGDRWPRFGVELFDKMLLPVLNSVLLIRSSVTLTIFHEYFMIGVYNFFYFFLSLFLGIWFLGVQKSEYFGAGYRIMDRVFGGNFFMVTGFHISHVLLGGVFLFICLFLFLFNKLNYVQLFLDFSVWYWHFVDVVWLYVFVLVYWWGFN